MSSWIESNIFYTLACFLIWCISKPRKVSFLWNRWNQKQEEADTVSWKTSHWVTEKICLAKSQATFLEQILSPWRDSVFLYYLKVPSSPKCILLFCDPAIHSNSTIIIYISGSKICASAWISWQQNSSHFWERLSWNFLLSWASAMSPQFTS